MGNIREFGFGSALTLSKHLNMQVIDINYQGEIQRSIRLAIFLMFDF